MTYLQIADLSGMSIDDVLALEWEYSGTIKSNTNRKGERIYHVPGGAYYARTKVDPAKGGRWFRTEEAARAAGGGH